MPALTRTRLLTAAAIGIAPLVVPILIPRLAKVALAAIVTDTSKLMELALGISTASSKIRAYAIEQARVSISQELALAGLNARVAALEAPTPPEPTPPPAPTRATGISTGYPSYAGYWSAAELDSYFGRIKAAGFRKVRLDYETSGAADKAVNAARKHDLEVMLIVLGTSTQSASVYSAIVQQAVTQYRDRVHEWQLMNEPNLPSKNFLSGLAYATIVRPSYAAIKTLQPNAIVHLGSIAQYGGGSTTSTDKSYPLNWLKSIYTVDRDFFDEVDIHPYGFHRNLSGAQAHALNQAWQQMCGDGNPSLRATMIANGDADKKITITEYGHPTWWGPWTATAYPAANGMDEAAARDATALAIADYRTRPYLRDFYVYSYRNRAPREGATDMQGYFGLERDDLTVKPAHALWTAENAGLNQ